MVRGLRIPVVPEEIRRQRLDAPLDKSVDDPKTILILFDDAQQVVDLDVHRSQSLPHILGITGTVTVYLAVVKEVVRQGA